MSGERPGAGARPRSADDLASGGTAAEADAATPADRRHAGLLPVLRSAIFWLWQIVVTLVLGGPVLLAGLFSFEAGFRLAKLWIRANVYGLRAICGVEWRVEGRENIPETPCLVLSKHQSTWETYFLPLLFSPAVYVAKRSLLWVPIFGWVLGVLRFIMIDRKSGSSAIAQMTEQAADRLARGRWVIVFPEGTRKAVGAPPDYRIGGAVVASRTGADILPVATNSGEYWPRLGFVKHAGTITVSVLPPIRAAGRDPSALIAETEASIEARMAAISGGKGKAATVVDGERRGAAEG